MEGVTEHLRILLKFFADAFMPYCYMLDTLLDYHNHKSDKNNIELGEDIPPFMAPYIDKI